MTFPWRGVAVQHPKEAAPVDTVPSLFARASASDELKFSNVLGREHAVRGIISDGMRRYEETMLTKWRWRMREISDVSSSMRKQLRRIPGRHLSYGPCRLHYQDELHHIGSTLAWLSGSLRLSLACQAIRNVNSRRAMRSKKNYSLCC